MEETALEFNEITKTFPGVKALDDVSFSCRRGEVHAVVGENGAGKSTLMKIVAGVYTPDSGDVLWNGSVARFSGPRDAQSQGIRIIYQELDLLPYMTLAENIALGREPLGRWRLMDRRVMERRAEELMRQLGVEVEVQTPVFRLSVAQQQLGEIAKALSEKASLLIMDEPTASLAREEVEKLFSIISLLKSQGVTVLYVSHRLEEIFRIADRVTVLKDGRYQGTFPVRKTSQTDLIRRMVGRELSEMYPPRGNGRGSVAMEVRNMVRLPRLRGVSFHVHAGEVLGIAGLVGSGRTELARSIFGADVAEQGEVRVRGHQAAVETPKRAAQTGLAFVTEDRKLEGLVLGLSVRENIALPSLASRQWLGFVRMKQERSLVQSYLGQLEVRTPSPEREVRFLSGGNQQKVVLAKWLATDPDVLIFDEPTRGIDVGAKTELYQIIREMADQGKAVVMISSDLPEILGMSDRVLVMRDGRVSGVLDMHEASEEAILTLATGDGDSSQKALHSTVAKKPSAESTGPAAPASGSWFPRSVLGEGRNVAVILTALLALLIFSFSVSEPFRSPYNLTNILRQGMALGMVSIGQTLALLAGGIDLSVGSVITLTNLFSAGLMEGSTALIAPVVLLCLALGAGIGLLNGTLVVFLRMPAFIVTLGTMTIGKGVALIYTRGPVGSISPAYRWMADGFLGPFPVPGAILAAALVLGVVFLRRVRSGHYIYAVGGNANLARLSGIPVRRIQLLAYVLCGTLAAATGLYLSSRMGSGDPNIGPGFELDSITAAIVGGTVLGGGQGGLVGAMGGVFLVSILNNVLNLLDVESWYQQIIKGCILLLAVGVYHRRD